MIPKEYYTVDTSEAWVFWGSLWKDTSVIEPLSVIDAGRCWGCGGGGGFGGMSAMSLWVALRSISAMSLSVHSHLSCTRRSFVRCLTVVRITLCSWEELSHEAGCRVCSEAWLRGRDHRVRGHVAAVHRLLTPAIHFIIRSFSNLPAVPRTLCSRCSGEITGVAVRNQNKVPGPWGFCFNQEKTVQINI